MAHTGGYDTGTQTLSLVPQGEKSRHCAQTLHRIMGRTSMPGENLERSGKHECASWPTADAMTAAAHLRPLLSIGRTASFKDSPRIDKMRAAGLP
ncbi:hypothetical protein [Nitrogeniibacter aestuarii]|uniref:hypothetical protein n=1 Tax=Nitrogeniibacter aestuarii TaxID=2815343 RepID=UPI001D1211A4|nr:hypothetical protein [Nitrogeniibacter aestuarii]